MVNQCRERGIHGLGCRIKLHLVPENNTHEAATFSQSVVWDSTTAYNSASEWFSAPRFPNFFQSILGCSSGNEVCQLTLSFEAESLHAVSIKFPPAPDRKKRTQEKK